MNPNEQQYPQNYQGPNIPAGGVPAQPVMTGQQHTQVANPGNQNSTQNSLKIAEVRDGIVIMNDGSYRAVIACQSINFDLMSPQEQEAVEYSYQGFLNSLYFDIQIYVRSQKVDIRPYIDKLQKIRTEHDNMLLALLMDDYISFIGNLSMQTNIMDKHFYIVVPFFPAGDIKDIRQAGKGFLSGIMGGNKQQKKVVISEKDLEAAKTELRNRVQGVMNGLQTCGVQTVPLDTQELIELYYDAYNPDTATRQRLREFKSLEMDVPVVRKGEGRAVQPHLEREMDI